MVRFDDEGLFGPYQVGSPVLDCLDDGQELLFVDIVVGFRWQEGA
jgi:hypothetical protein